MTIVEFLTARLDERERQARLEKQMADDFFPDMDISYQWVRFVRDAPGGGLERSSSFSPGAPSPSEVLADIAAKRALVADEIAPYFHDGVRVGTLPTSRVLRVLASVYADHPDCDPKWVDTPE